MKNNSTNKIYLPDLFDILNTNKSIFMPKMENGTVSGEIKSTNTASEIDNLRFSMQNENISAEYTISANSVLEQVAQWFLGTAAMSHKKLQKMCYYAYCWHMVFFNDVEMVENEADIMTLFPNKFQAWIHGPVVPELYQKYRSYGWQEIPMLDERPNFNDEVEAVLVQVWDAYGGLSADELEALSHNEDPWINARKGIRTGEACTREIANTDILKYYSSLG